METEKKHEYQVPAENREKILGTEKSGNLSALQEKSRGYKARLQEKSVAHLPSYMQAIYKITDYVGITSPDRRLAEIVKTAENSSARQHFLMRQREKSIEELRENIVEKHELLMDSTILYLQKCEELGEINEKMAAISEENESLPNSYNRAVVLRNNFKSAIEMQHKKSILESERERCAAKIEEYRTEVSEYQNQLTALEGHRELHSSSYFRSKTEIARTRPMLSSSNSPAETIDSLVQDQKCAEMVEGIANDMSEWLYDISSDISDVAITSGKRKNIYDKLRKKRTESSSRVCDRAEKILAEMGIVR